LKEEGNENEVRYVVGMHGAALARENHSSIAEFIHNDKVEPPQGLIRKDQTAQEETIVFFSRMCWLVWLGLLAIVALVGAVICVLTYQFLPMPWPAIFYSGLVVLILYTV